MTTREPQSAADYEDRTTAAVKSVLIEIGQILGSYKGKFTVIGGAVPWLLLNNDDMPHVGTLDMIWIWIQQRWAMVNTPLWWKVCRVAGMNSERASPEHFS